MYAGTNRDILDRVGQEVVPSTGYAEVFSLYENTPHSTLHTARTLSKSRARTQQHIDVYIVDRQHTKLGHLLILTRTLCALQ